MLFSILGKVGATELSSEDYSDQLGFLGGEYNQGVALKKLKKSQITYLNTLYKRIRKKNERVFPLTSNPQFYVVKDEGPFYFSLPNNSYYFSRGLIQKYFKNELALISCLTYMMLQAHNKVFLKRTVVPIGYISTDQIISLIKLPLNLKAGLNKSVFMVLNHMGIEGGYYLQWIQLQNRNTLDFVRQIGDPQFITKEEFLFKQFISKKTSDAFSVRQVSFNSSRSFYNFIRGI